MQRIARADKPLIAETALVYWLPVLVLPVIIIGALVLIWPESARLRQDWLLAAVVVALGWFGLGAVASIRKLRRGFGLRQELRAFLPTLAGETSPVWVTDASDTVIFQNRAAIDLGGDRRGQMVTRLLARYAADPATVLSGLVRRAEGNGRAHLRLADWTLTLNLRRDGDLRIWRMSQAGGVKCGDDLPQASTQTPATVAGAHGLRIDDLPVATLGLDSVGVLRYANRAARAILGEVTEGTHFSSLVDGFGRPLSDWLADIMTGRAEGRPEVLRARNGGVDAFVQVTLARDGAGGLVAVLSDATAIKKLEAQFVQSQKMQAIGQLAGGIAHDFNNLLTAITGHCDLLMLRHDKDDPEYADLDQISQNANRAAALVGQLLAFSRKQTLKPQVIDLRDTLADLTHLLNRLVGERVHLTFEHDPFLLPIRADKRQFEQVVMNLVVNARDAMPSGGEIIVTTDNVFLGEETSRDQVALPGGEYVRVRVSDQGCGIAPDRLEKIFEPFYTTKRTGEGTGLGLSTAYGIVKQTGGYIFCDSSLGQGTEFSLYFPAHEVNTLSPQQVETALEVECSIQARESAGVVLLVEDEAPVRAFARRALSLQGFEVIEADCAEAALEQLQDQKLKVDVFVTDVVMPGMDGPSWVRTALHDRPGTRVVFVSGYTEDIFSEGREPVPGAVFLPKPFSLTELTSLVQQQMRIGNEL